MKPYKSVFEESEGNFAIVHKDKSFRRTPIFTGNEKDVVAYWKVFAKGTDSMSYKIINLKDKKTYILDEYSTGLMLHPEEF